MNNLIFSIEDDLDISRLINIILTKQGYSVKSFNDGKSFFETFEKEKPDLILLDLMLPDVTGEEILKRIKQDKSNKEIEIIVLSAKNSLLNRVDLLDLGADDFISKPFEVLELISRVNARMRRHQVEDEIDYLDLKIYPSKKEVYRNNELIELSRNEYKILFYLIENKDRVISRDELLNKIWGKDLSYETRVIDVHIKEIRKKLNPKNNQDYIISIYGEGYKLK